MGGACSVGGRISSDELDELNKVQIVKKKKNKNKNNDQISEINTNNNGNNDSSMLINFNNKLRRMKSFGNLKKINNNNKNKKKNVDEFDQLPSPSPQRFFSGELRFSGTDNLDKVTPRGSSFIGRASFAGLEKAVDVLDALGSGMTNLNGSGFLTGKTTKTNKISILAFEVANTITRGEKLLQSLSVENERFIKEEVIHSQGVQYLVSSDTKVLLSLVASDKREELDVFCKEITRFGNHCKDPQWHYLDRFFLKLDSENGAYRQEREQAEEKMKDLMALAEHTSELYHELNAFDRYEQDYRQKVEEMTALNLPRKGEHLMMLNSELRQQKKIVMSLKKKSLWSKKLEEVIEKLVDIVAFIRQEITEVFGTGQATHDDKPSISSPRLGPAGLALHYANVINQMDNIASRPTSLPPNVRDTLYRGLPASVKDALRCNLRKLDSEDELEVPQIKAKMEKILEWLSPMAMNTLKAHQGFGWVGEWANSSTEFSKKTGGSGHIIRLQTLYHAKKETTDAYILTLITLLHRLISGIKRIDQRDHGLSPLPFPSPTKNMSLKIYPSIYDAKKSIGVKLAEEDLRLLKLMSKSRSGPGISKSQELHNTGHKVIKLWTRSRSTESSPYRDLRTTHSQPLHATDFELVGSHFEAPL
ncbi:protein PSK SIMULATOR 2-like [Silene latifolia]|uniref:protein PSK SIMULATOR 2-like n=1 Tax=Silene latifolia TaxID=37657 RepID=UPI003D76F8AE